MKARCLWCRGESLPLEAMRLPEADEALVHVHPEHRTDLERFAEGVRRHQTRFLLLLLVGTPLLAGVVVLLAVAWGPVAARVGAGLLLAWVGTVLLVLPFATPQTVRWLGVRRSVALVRTLGVLLVLGAVATALLA